VHYPLCYPFPRSSDDRTHWPAECSCATCFPDLLITIPTWPAECVYYHLFPRSPDHRNRLGRSALKVATQTDQSLSTIYRRTGLPPPLHGHRRHKGPYQKPERPALQRDEAAIEQRKRRAWPYIKTRQPTWGPRDAGTEASPSVDVLVASSRLARPPPSPAPPAPPRAWLW
jgi:hypothetical protein